MYAKSLDEIRQSISQICTEVNEPKKNERRKINIPRGATGSGAGLPFEKWFMQEIQTRTRYKVFGRLGFMRYVIDNLLREDAGLDKLLRDTWWASLQQFSEGVIKRIRENKEPKIQQALGDVVIKYDEGQNDVVLINIKATEVSDGKPVGRAPNIVSAYRLLQFFLDLFQNKRNLADKVNVWLVGFYYNPVGGGEAEIIHCYFRDLFKLDLENAPPINFDAAMQIQWHLGEMKERREQTLEEFAERLANKFLNEWRLFAQQRSKRVEGMVQRLLNVIKTPDPRGGL